MYCTSCGTEFPIDGKFCPGCGRRINNNNSDTTYYAVGINLGATVSQVAVIEGGKPVIVPSVEGNNMVPSVVSVNETGERLVGQLARSQMIINPENTIYGIKRFIGRKWGEPAGRELPVKEDASRYNYKVTKETNNDIRVILRGEKFRPQEISAMILTKLKSDAEAYLGKKVTQAVITVPAHFNDAQRSATKEAGAIAGLNVLKIIDEPTAAALAFSLDQSMRTTVAVYDFGGSSFDISILEFHQGTFQVKSTSGDSHLGGNEFDWAIMGWLVDEFKSFNGINLFKEGYSITLQRLKEAAEKAKIELSTVEKTEVNLPFIFTDASGPKHLNISLTRTKLEKLVENLVDRTFELCRHALSRSNKDYDLAFALYSLDDVILVGGQTRMPMVRRKIEDYFFKKPKYDVDPENAVAIGAAMQAAILKERPKDKVLQDYTPSTIRLETPDGMSKIVIPKNTKLPASKTLIATTKLNNQSSIEFNVIRGERLRADNNQLWCKVKIDGIAPSPSGIPKIEIKFDIDANSVLTIRSRDLGTGRDRKIIINRLA